MATPPVTLPTGQKAATDDREHRRQPAALRPRSGPADPEEAGARRSAHLRGVVNGVMCACPRMVAQGHGHIVNTASLARLCGTPMVAAYSMTKHGVVGLTTSLPPEAAALHGVKVGVV